MKRQLYIGASLAVLLVSSAIAGDALKSGPQPGEPVGIPFNPLHVNGDDAGSKRCLV